MNHVHDESCSFGNPTCPAFAEPRQAPKGPDFITILVGVFLGVLLAGGTLWLIHDAMASAEEFDCVQRNNDLSLEQQWLAEEC